MPTLYYFELIWYFNETNYYMLQHKYLYNLQSWTNLEESIEIQQTWKRLENLNIFFCLFFDSNCQNFISGKETGHYVSTQISDPYISWFPKILSLRNLWGNSIKRLLRLDIEFLLLVANGSRTKTLKAFQWWFLT